MARTIDSVLTEIKAKVGIDTEQVGPNYLDAQFLLAFLLDKPRSFLIIWPEYILSQSLVDNFYLLWQRREQGEPLAYLIGNAPFLDLSLAVNKDTLVPRPETEELVLWILEHYPSTSFKQVLDLGTGSGAIILTLAKARPHWDCHASDKMMGALMMAKNNAQRLGLNHIHWYESDWFSHLPQGLSFDLIIANPPYLSPNDPHLSEDGLRFEPYTALVSEESGLADLKHIIGEAPSWLNAQGWLILEHGYEQGQAVRSLFQERAYQHIDTKRDLQGKERFTLGQREA